MKRYAVNFYTKDGKYDGYEVSCGKKDGSEELEDLLNSVISNMQKKNISDIVEVVEIDA